MKNIVLPICIIAALVTVSLGDSLREIGNFSSGNFPEAELTLAA
ncbi:hypothetical protein [Candidatus Francisella endociliophora]|nr:hypothetical protein [Francisella sp. FSC1006]